MNKFISKNKIILSLIDFVVLWTLVTDAWGYSDHFNINYGKYIYAYLSRLIWVLPAVLLIVKYSNSLYFSSRQCFSWLRFQKPLKIVMIVSLIYTLIMMFIYHRGFWFNKEVNLPLEILKFVLVGFVEETVFRGWGYNALAKVVSDKKAITISTIFFILLHWPAYFIKLYRFGTFDIFGVISQSSVSFFCGVVCCWLLKRETSLWNCIIAHAFYDIVFVLLVG